jgi:dienelactone hydrolase
LFRGRAIRSTVDYSRPFWAWLSARGGCYHPRGFRFTVTPASNAQEVVVFHSALGLRPALLRWAARLRAAGHVVHTPDLYDGEVFNDRNAAADKIQQLGFDEIRFAADAGHELRTPLTSVLANLDLLSEELDGERAG